MLSLLDFYTMIIHCLDFVAQIRDVKIVGHCNEIRYVTRNTGNGFLSIKRITDNSWDLVLCSLSIREFNFFLHLCLYDIMYDYDDARFRYKLQKLLCLLHNRTIMYDYDIEGVEIPLVFWISGYELLFVARDGHAGISASMV